MKGIECRYDLRTVSKEGGYATIKKNASSLAISEYLNIPQTFVIRLCRENKVYRKRYRIVKTKEIVWTAEKDGVEISAKSLKGIAEQIGVAYTTAYSNYCKGNLCLGWDIYQEWENING